MIKPERVLFPSQLVVPIAGNGSIAGQAVEGVNVPALILDTTNRPDIVELVRVHEVFSAGDVVVQWAVADNTVLLVLEFLRPIEAKAIIPFDIADHGILVDTILWARAVYLQAGKPGDRISDDFSAPKILVQVGETGFDEKWDSLYFTWARGHFRSKGFSRRDARDAAHRFIAEVRTVSQFRLPAK